ncbi:Ac45/VOA1 transmembrane domain-containing protein [Aspergillus neoniger CBS 115656]|uniref:Protein BIG1 n=1 Tax=Aspergillus neoniger (strain CBS 115656) TaxID=1448310 RepID=A0A318Y5B3_ASPNB|nr:BIG1-domain-containing protein [Aspergillus neoniger CBS 115656]PYH29446.1 BIG1-domain-containing protein [Aspergillus neoniger CBS 115656]
MRLGTFSLLALGATTANAIRDTSPFFLASTSQIPSTSAQLRTAPAILEDLSTGLSGCPSDYYVIASQPGVHSTDFATRQSAPRLGGKMTGKDKNIRTKTIVNEVVGEIEAKDVQKLLEKECGAESTLIDASSDSHSADFDAESRIIVVDLPVLPAGHDRKKQLSNNDGLLFNVIDRLPESKGYTILYVTSPRELEDTGSDFYQAEQDPLHMDLKRDYSAHDSQSSSNKTLFQEYQFFTPGIWMGILATLVFLMIFYVGLSALLSLEVPYAAFEKDTSAAVQKKQQ